MTTYGLAGRHRKINRTLCANGMNGANGTHGMNSIKGVNGFSIMGEPHKRRRLFVLSAFHEAIGGQQIARLKTFVESRIKHATDDFMEDLSYTLAECRTHHTWRRAITAGSAEELLKILQTDSVKFSKSKRAVRLGFLFTGQGAQWFAMGRELMDQYPIFLESLCKAESYLTEMGAQWSLKGTKHSRKSILSLTQRNRRAHERPKVIATCDCISIPAGLHRHPGCPC
jgi:hypothetical protein